MNEEALRKKILDTIKSTGGRKLKRREIYNLVKIKSVHYEDFKSTMTSLEKLGSVVRLKGRKYVIPEGDSPLAGIFSLSRNGNGYVDFTDRDSVFIKSGNIGDAMSGDTVLVRIFKRKRTDDFPPSGEIVKIVERSSKPVIGILKKQRGSAYLIPSGGEFPGNLPVLNSDMTEAEDGDLVVCSIGMPAKGFSQPVCEITEVLGDPDTPGIDVLSIAKRYELNIDFPEDVIRECENISADLGPEIIESRMDIRDIVTFTVDPDDAKDFDDAISVSRRDDGGFELGVHIADVSHYVKEGTALDIEAQARAMSSYLVDRVIPMLPERLSNDLCSLIPKTDRLTKSVFITLDKAGEIVNSRAANTVINSDMRLTYSQVQSFLDGQDTNGADEITPGTGKALEIFSEMADVLIDIRNKRGSLDLELPEAKVILDDNGKPVDIVKYDRFKSNRMIEEAMLLANTVTANMLAGRKAVFLYRIHDKPDIEKLESFGETANMLGYSFNMKKTTSQKYIQKFLISIQGTSCSRMMSTHFLRSMKKAEYSPENIGHYGLALEKYAHFTSPIRRYPDIIVHRKLDESVKKHIKGPRENKFMYYKYLGEYITQREILIDSAERDSIKMKKAEFMKEHIGAEFDGTVSGIIPKGIFVELDEYFVEGLIRVSDIEDDYYEIDTAGISMTGRNTGNRFMIGDRLKIFVASADKERGEVNFMLIDRLKKSKVTGQKS
ncbi:ribonuclease R [Candidatus Latescibacterota bacterium]